MDNKETALELDGKEVLVYGGVKLLKGRLIDQDGNYLVDQDGNKLYGYGIVPNEDN